MTKRLFLIGLIVSGLSITGCGKKASDAPPPRTDDASQTPPAADKSADRPVTAEKNAEATGTEVSTREIRGSGTTGDNESIAVTLNVDAANRVSGSFRRGDIQLDVYGVLDGEVLRCWMSQTEGDAWRGTLMARGGESFDGVFAMSNSGAAEVVSGKWQSE